MQQLLLDVSDLPAPEPFEQIMAALATLQEDQYLRVQHRKQPVLLYKPLQELGFSFHVQAGQHQPYDIFIWSDDQHTPPGLTQPNLAVLDTSKQHCDDH